MSFKGILRTAGAVILLLAVLVLPAGKAVGQTGPRKHVVEAIDNFFSISLKYNVSIEDLKKANPGITSPKPGDVLIIPDKGQYIENKPATTAKPGKAHHETFHVALMVPFYLEQLEDTNWRHKLESSKIGELAPFRFVQFYQGFMMAADSLRQRGLNVEIHVYDVDQQTSKAEKVLKKPEMKEMDLIIGPFLKNTFPIVADFARENNIWIINPFSPRNDILLDNPNVFKLLPSVESQPALVARLVKRDFSDYNIILYIPNKIQDAELIGQYRQAIEQNDLTENHTVTVIDYATDSIRGFQRYASRTQSNLIIVFSQNEVLPAALLNRLNAMKSDYQITVIGLPEWDKFGNIESGFLMSLNANILVSSYVDYRSDAVRGFVNAYRAKYFDEPMTYAFSGFDAGYFFLGSLLEFGRDFADHLEEIDIPLIQNQFHFERTGNGGYDNLNWNILYYYDYSLYRKYSY